MNWTKGKKLENIFVLATQWIIYFFHSNIANNCFSIVMINRYREKYVQSMCGVIFENSKPIFMLTSYQVLKMNFIPISSTSMDLFKRPISWTSWINLALIIDCGHSTVVPLCTVIVKCHFALSFCIVIVHCHIALELCIVTMHWNCELSLCTVIVRYTAYGYLNSEYTYAGSVILQPFMLIS